MKIGVISDIHSNLMALEIALKSLEGCDEIICLGDICSFGPQTNECFDLLCSVSNLTLLKGNHDAYSTLSYPLKDKKNFSDELENYLNMRTSNVSPKYLNLIKSLPYSVERTILDTRILFIHFPWESSFDSKKLGALPLNELDFKNLFNDLDSDLVIYGHTHYPHDTIVFVGGKYVRYVNFGPLGVTHDLGPYVRFGIVNILPNNNINIEFKREKYSVGKVISLIEGNNHPYNKFVLEKFYNYKK